MKELIYLDSCIVIYLVERHPIYEMLLRDKLAAVGQAQLAVSPLVRIEVLVHPLRNQNTDLEQLYRLFLAEQISLSMPEEVFDAALTLRVSNNLKTPDALHLATAQHHGCTQFWTNDERLARASAGTAINIAGTQGRK